jgi:hypothetical protein
MARTLRGGFGRAALLVYDDLHAAARQNGRLHPCASGRAKCPASPTEAYVCVHAQGLLGEISGPRRGWADLAPPLRNRRFADSPLEGDGFEPSVLGDTPCRQAIPEYDAAGMFSVVAIPPIANAWAR